MKHNRRLSASGRRRCRAPGPIAHGTCGGVSDAADHADRAIRRRRPDRCAGAHSCRADADDARPDGPD